MQYTLAVREKICTGCKLSFPVIPFVFTRQKSRKDGWGGYCRFCRHRTYVQNREQRLEYDRRWKEKNRTPAKVRASSSQQRARKEQRAKEGLALPSTFERQTGRRPVSKMHPYPTEEMRRFAFKASRVAAASNYRAKARYGVTGKLNRDDIYFVFERFCGRCAYCNVDVLDDYVCDHVIPLSRGGENCVENLALSCFSCNSSKKQRTLEEWKR